MALSKTYEAVQIEGVTYMDDVVSGWKYQSDEQCSATGTQRLNKFRLGLAFYTETMVKEDADEFYTKCYSSAKPDCCWKHIEDWTKQIANRMKISGVRGSYMFTAFLDLVSLGGWTQYSQEEAEKQAMVFTKVKEEQMFPEWDDQTLYDAIYRFCSTHIVLEQPKMTLERWIVSREWANHGTASDVMDKQELFARDKSTLAYIEKGSIFPLTHPIKNEVFPKRDRKERIIVVGPTNEYIYGSYVNHIFVEGIITAPFQITNTVKSVRWRDEIRKQVLSDSFQIPIDQSAFDQNQRKSSVLAVRDFLVDTAVQVTGFSELKTLREFSEEWVTGRGEKLGDWESGLLSGKWYTSIAGSILNAFEVYMCLDQDWSKVDGISMHQGDDAQMCMKSIEMIVDVFANAKKYVIPFNPAKNFVEKGRTDYLHNMCSNNQNAPRLGGNTRNYRLWINKYPARCFTSILDGDQEASKESTFYHNQSTWVMKNTDRLYAALTRLNCFNDQSVLKILEKIGIKQIEFEYMTTPTTVGGLGCSDLGEPSTLVAPANIPPKYFGIVQNVGGYEEAVRITSEQFSMDLKLDAVKLIEQRLRFGKLPPSVSKEVKSKFYNLRKVKYRIQLTALNPSIERQLKIKEFEFEPVTTVDPYWKALGAVVSAENDALWSNKSKETYTALARAGKHVQKMWSKGDLKIKVIYSRYVAGEVLSYYTDKYTLLLLSYLVNNRGTDVGVVKLRSLMFELEMLCKKEIGLQSDLYENV